MILIFFSVFSVKQMDPWTRPGVAATLWPNWNWWMEKLISSPPCPSLPFLVTKEHCCRSQMICTDWYMGSKWLAPFLQTVLFFSAVTLWSQRLLSLWTVLCISVTDNTFWRLLDGFEKHSCPFHSQISFFALCMNSSSVVRLSFSDDCRDQLPSVSLNLKGTVSILRGLSDSLYSFHFINRTLGLVVFETVKDMLCHQIVKYLSQTSLLRGNFPLQRTGTQ